MTLLSQGAVDPRPPQRRHGDAEDARRIPVLDGVRGLAILLVLLHHGFGAFTVTGRGEALLRAGLGTFGWVGVDLFFVLSGFLITGILLDTKDSPTYLRSFYMRRVVRIFPLYYGTLVLFFFVLPQLSSWAATKFQGTTGNQMWYWTYLMNYHNSLPQAPLGHFWSLCVEEQFYLFWPLMIGICSARGLRYVCAVLLVVPLVLRIVFWLNGFNDEAIAFYSITRVDALMYGAVVAILARSCGLFDGGISKTVVQVLFWILAGILAGLFVVTRGLPRSQGFVETTGFTLIDLFFAAMLVRVMQTGEPSMWHTVFNSGWLRSFGKYSYAMYVFNWPLVNFLRYKVSPDWEHLPTISGSQVPASILFTLAASVLTYLAAMLSYHLYEKHFLKLKRHFRSATTR